MLRSAAQHSLKRTPSHMARLPHSLLAASFRSNSFSKEWTESMQNMKEPNLGNHPRSPMRPRSPLLTHLDLDARSAKAEEKMLQPSSLMVSTTCHGLSDHHIRSFGFNTANFSFRLSSALGHPTILKRPQCSRKTSVARKRTIPVVNFRRSTDTWGKHLRCRPLQHLTFLSSKRNPWHTFRHEKVHERTLR